MAHYDTLPTREFAKIKWRSIVYLYIAMLIPWLSFVFIIFFFLSGDACRCVHIMQPNDDDLANLMFILLYFCISWAGSTKVLDGFSGNEPALMCGCMQYNHQCRFILFINFFSVWQVFLLLFCLIPHWAALYCKLLHTLSLDWLQ